MTEVKTCPICDSKSFHDFLNCVDYTVSHETFSLKRCTNCSILLTNPRPDDNNLGKYYQSVDYISHAKKAITLTDRIYLVARRFTLRWKTNLINKYHKSTKSITLLDYGCGTGTFLEACSEKGWDVSGFEPSSTARHNSNAKVKERIKEHFNDLPKTQFDVITLWHVLEHIPNPREIIIQLKDKLHQNGTLLIAVPNPMSWDSKHYKKYWAGYDVPRHLWHFTQPTISRLAKANELEVVQTIPMKLDAYYVSLLSEKYKSPESKLLNFLRGFMNGLRSNINASSTSEYSSLIYVLKKR